MFPKGIQSTFWFFSTFLIFSDNSEPKYLHIFIRTYVLYRGLDQHCQKWSAVEFVNIFIFSDLRRNIPESSFPMYFLKGFDQHVLFFLCIFGLCSYFLDIPNKNMFISSFLHMFYIGGLIRFVRNDQLWNFWAFSIFSDLIRNIQESSFSYVFP